MMMNYSQKKNQLFLSKLNIQKIISISIGLIFLKISDCILENYSYLERSMLLKRSAMRAYVLLLRI